MARQQNSTWIPTAIIAAGALLLAGGIVAGSAVLVVLGVVVVLAGAAAGLLLPRLGLSGPISFSEEFPQNTVGPRATKGGRSGPPIDTDPGRTADHEPRPEALQEILASEEPAPPDKERAFAQYVNLAPHELLRRRGGHDIIEMPEHEVDEQ